MEARCVCGAVTITAEAKQEALFACHCALCMWWSGSMQTGFEADPATVTVEGPVRTYDSTSFSERAWCELCGTALWIRDKEGGAYDFTAGLFPQTHDWPIRNENYVDTAWPSLLLSGEHPRYTKAEYEENCRFAEVKR